MEVQHTVTKIFFGGKFMAKRKKVALAALLAATIMSVAGAVVVSASGITYDITTSGMTAIEKDFYSSEFSTVYSQTNPKTVTSSLVISVAPNTTAARTGKVDGYIQKKTLGIWTNACSVQIKTNITVPSSQSTTYLSYSKAQCGTATVTLDANTSYRGRFKETALAAPADASKVSITPHMYVNIDM